MAQDTGYSNWTVMETELSCLKDLNEGLPAEESYRWETEMSDVNSFAEKCDSFREGESIHVDVEQEEGAMSNYSDDREVKELLNVKYG